MIPHHRTPQPPKLTAEEIFRSTSPIPKVPSGAINFTKAKGKKKTRLKGNSDRVEAELTEFKREIEEKYARSTMNKTYVFPRLCESPSSLSEKSDKGGQDIRMPMLKVMTGVRHSKKLPVSPNATFGKDFPARKYSLRITVLAGTRLTLRYEQTKDIMNKTFKASNAKTFDFPHGFLTTIQN